MPDVVPTSDIAVSFIRVAKLIGSGEKSDLMARVGSAFAKSHVGSETRFDKYGSELHFRFPVDQVSVRSCLDEAFERGIIGKHEIPRITLGLPVTSGALSESGVSGGLVISL